MITKVCCFYYRNQAYDTRIKLAVLDHNAHINREQLTAKTGKRIYSRKYRKSSKKWDVTPALKPKQYEYIADLLLNVRKHRMESTLTSRHQVVRSEQHPGLIQTTVGHVPPATTDELVRNKRSRFQ